MDEYTNNLHARIDNILADAYFGAGAGVGTPLRKRMPPTSSDFDLSIILWFVLGVVAGGLIYLYVYEEDEEGEEGKEGEEFPSLYTRFTRQGLVTPRDPIPLKPIGHGSLKEFTFHDLPWNYGPPLLPSRKAKQIANNAIAEETTQRNARLAAAKLNKERAAANAEAAKRILEENTITKVKLFNSLQGHGGRRTKKRNRRRNRNRSRRPTHTSA